MFKEKKPARENLEGGSSLVEVMAAIVVVGIGVALFMKTQGMTSRVSSVNSKILLAGKLIEKHLEDTRIKIAQDTVANWPPKDTTITPSDSGGVKLRRTISDALSPKDGTVVSNVKRMDLVVSWTRPYPDTVKVTTYVAKRF